MITKKFGIRIKDPIERAKTMKDYRGPRIYLEDGTDYMLVCIIQSKSFMDENGIINYSDLANSIPINIKENEKMELATKGMFETEHCSYILVDCDECFEYN